MDLRGVSWCFAVALALVCGARWSPAHCGSLAPENEVPLRPSAGLEEGKVTTLALPKGRTRRLYFTLKKKALMMAVTVSPCDVPLEWSLTSRTVKDTPLKSLQWSPKKSVPEVWWRGPGSEDKIYSYTGNAMDTYTGPPHAAASIYILRLRSTEEDTRAEVYLHVGPGTPGAFPQLPVDPRVHILGVGMTSVTLSWEPSPSLARKGHDYCVLVNPDHNYPSLCAARERPRKVKGPDKPQRRRGGGRKEPGPGKRPGWWPLSKDRGRGQRGHQQQRQRRKGSYRPETRRESTPAPRGDDYGDLPCACRGAENVCTVSELLPEVQYYFDVFVVDAANGTSAAYTGTFARTHEEAKPAVAQLREGELRWVTFRGGATAAAAAEEQLFSFRPRGWQQNGLLTLQSCGGSKGQRVKVTVSTKGRVLSSQVLGGDLVQIWLHGSSSYLVHLERDAAPLGASGGGGGPGLKMQASSAYHRMGAPSLPSTLQIKSFKRLRGCSSVTLAWMGTEERSLYCVYRRRLPDGDGDGGHKAPDAPCLGPESRADKEQVLCKYFQELNPRRAVTTAVIGGLEPGTAYVFDVYLMRRWGIAVKYVSKTIRTRKEC